jgi:hypothetical protein
VAKLRGSPLTVTGDRASLILWPWWCLKVGLPGKTGRGLTTMKDEATYVCDSCGEEIVVPIDLSVGASQEYVEDCPVSCRPNVIHVEVEEDGDVRVWAERE